MFRAVLKGEVRDDTLLHTSSEKVFLFYFPKDSAADSLKRGDELLVRTRLSAPVSNGIRMSLIMPAICFGRECAELLMCMPGDGG